MANWLKGLVLISLHAPHNQSEGKTIAAAFRVLDSSNPNRQTQLRRQIKRLLNVKRVLGFLGSSFLMFFLLQCLFSQAHFDYNPSGEHGNNSFVYTLHSKSDSGFQPQAALKLGTFVMRDEIRHNRLNHDENDGVLSINSSTIFPVRGNVYPDGLYYASVLVGNPPKPYYLDMDTGSDLTWIQCDAPCTSCAKGPHPLYKPTRDKIVPPMDSLCLEVKNNQNKKHCKSCLQCDYEIEYADHSSSLGVLARDSMQLMITNGTLIKTNLVFGCAYDQRGPLLVSPAKVDGILGLSRAKVSLPSQLVSQGIMKNVVGHCITSDIKGGGYMFLGDGFVPWGMTWVPMLNRPSTNFYHAGIAKISFGGHQLGGLANNAGRVVFDSGSSYTYFTKEAYTSLISCLKDVSSEGLVRDESDLTLPMCWRAKSPARSFKDVRQSFKPLTLHFSNRWWSRSTTLEIPPEGYLVISDKGNPCLGILDGSKLHDGTTIILGDISLRGQLIVYDNVNQKIGWVQSDCIKPQRLKSFPFF